MDRYNEPTRFDFSRIIGDPFALATISIAIVRSPPIQFSYLALTRLQLAWLIAFISSIYSDVKDTFPNFAWWALVFMLLCILMVTVCVAMEAEDVYSVAVCRQYSSIVTF